MRDFRLRAVLRSIFPSGFSDDGAEPVSHFDAPERPVSPRASAVAIQKYQPWTCNVRCDV